jgi:hypothetical protein
MFYPFVPRHLRTDDIGARLQFHLDTACLPIGCVACSFVDKPILLAALCYNHPCVGVGEVRVIRQVLLALLPNGEAVSARSCHCHLDVV